MKIDGIEYSRAIFNRNDHIEVVRTDENGGTDELVLSSGEIFDALVSDGVKPFVRPKEYTKEESEAEASYPESHLLKDRVKALEQRLKDLEGG